MITYADCFFAGEREGLGEFAEDFISEIDSFEDERFKWEKYEECKNILKTMSPFAEEYEIAMRKIAERLGV